MVKLRFARFPEDLDSVCVVSAPPLLVQSDLGHIWIAYICECRFWVRPDFNV